MRLSRCFPKRTGFLPELFMSLVTHQNIDADKQRPHMTENVPPTGATLFHAGCNLEKTQSFAYADALFFQVIILIRL